MTYLPNLVIFGSMSKLASLVLILYVIYRYTGILYLITKFQEFLESRLLRLFKENGYTEKHRNSAI